MGNSSSLLSAMAMNTCLILLAMASMVSMEPDTTATTMDTLPTMDPLPIGRMVVHNPATSSHLLPASHSVFKPTLNQGTFNPTMPNRGIFNHLTYNGGIFNPTTYNRGIFNPTLHQSFMHPMGPLPHHLAYKMNPMAYRLLPFPALSHQSLRTMSPVKTSTTKVHAVSKREAEASTSTTLTMPGVSTHPTTYSHLLRAPHLTTHGAIASNPHTTLPFTQDIRSLAYTSLPYAHSNLPYVHNNLPYVHNNLPYVHNTIPYAHNNIHMSHGIHSNIPFIQGNQGIEASQGICMNHPGMIVPC